MVLPPLVPEDYVCDACQIAYSDMTLLDSVRLIQTVPDSVESALANTPPAGLHVRRIAASWTVAEYLCHLRDVFVTYTIRLHQGHTEGVPTVTPMFNDLRAVRFRYNATDPLSVASELSLAILGFCDETEEVGDSDWNRVVARGIGEHRSLQWLVRQAAHEGHHHVNDIRQLCEELERW